MLTAKQAHLISDIERLSVEATTPLQKLEHALHPITAYFILPVFALANAGIHIEGSFIDLILHPVSIGIIAGLLFGKSIGITLLCKIAVRFKIAELPEGTSWRHIYGAGFLAGIGFTMSIFIASLAYLDEQLVQIAKAGIFVASFLAAIIGLTILSVQSKNK